MRGQTKQHPGPPGRGLGVGPATLRHKRLHCYRNTRRIPRDTSAWGANGPLARRPMTPGSESQVHLEAARPTTIISSRTTTTIRTWNVRAMYETGKKAQVASEIRNYRLSILGISESRWTGSSWRLLITEKVLLLSGHEQENAPHTQLWLWCCLGLP